MPDLEHRKPMPMARPRPERMVAGRTEPERPVESGRDDEIADLTGIEIDHAFERPAD